MPDETLQEATSDIQEAQSDVQEAAQAVQSDNTPEAQSRLDAAEARLAEELGIGSVFLSERFNVKDAAVMAGAVAAVRAALW